MTMSDEKTVAAGAAPVTEVVLPPPADPVGDAQRDLAADLIERARMEGVSSVGPGGLLADLTKRVLEAGSEVEMGEHLGYEKHTSEGRNGGSSRDGTRPKRPITEIPHPAQSTRRATATSSTVA